MDGKGTYEVVDGVLFEPGKKMLHSFPRGRGGSYSIPEGVTGINAYAFFDALPHSVTLPESLVNVEAYAFYLSRLRSVTIHKGTKKIGSRAFGSIQGLESVYWFADAEIAVPDDAFVPRSGDTELPTLYVLKGEKAKLEGKPWTGSTYFKEIVECYTVTFDSDGGGVVEPIMVPEGQMAAKPEKDPTKAGYVFVEWQLNGKAFDFESTQITDDITLKATWAEDYMITVGATRVTALNADNVLGDTEKSVVYDPIEKVLTLNNASIGSIHGKGGSGLKTIELIGTTTIVTGASDALNFQFSSAVTIRGTGKLVAKGAHKYGIYKHHGSLTVKGGCELELTGAEYGIRVYNGTLSVDGSTIRAKGGTASISCDKGLTLTGDCGITSPAGAFYSSTLKGVARDGALVTDEVVIEPTIKTYTISCATVENSTLSTDPSGEAEEGATVTIKAEANEGHQLKAGTLKVYKTEDETQTVELSGNTFAMPAFAVTVTCEFEAIEQPTPPTPPTPDAVESVLLSEARALANPFGATLELTNVENATRVEIYSLLGQLVYSQPLTDATYLRINATGWNSGLYLVRLTDTEDGVRAIRIVKR